jgi:outer membrane protein TolC
MKSKSLLIGSNSMSRSLPKEVTMAIERVVRLAAATLLAALLGGCMSTSETFAPVQSLSTPELGTTPQIIATEDDATAAQALTASLIKQPLSSDTAVRIALLNNKALQASYNDLGIAQAALIKASVPANPVIAIDRTTGAGALEIERQLLINIFSIATIPARREIAMEQLRATQMRAAEATLRTAMDARRQYLRTVAASERIGKLQKIKQLTDASADLAKRLGETGAMNKLDQAREFALAAELDSEIARARLEEKLERERLIRALGLWGDQIAIRWPSQLPPLPRTLRKETDLEGEAIRRRADLQAARHDLAALATSLGLTQATRFVTDVDLLGNRIYDRANTEGGRETARLTKLGLDIEIPLFDFGTARTLDAEQRYMRAANLLADKAIRVRSEVREAYLAYQGTHQIARHFDTQILPLRKTIQEEALLHYNGMLSDVTALITDTRAGIITQMRAVDAKRDFFISETNLQAAIVGGGSSASIGSGAPAVAAAEPAGH